MNVPENKVIIEKYLNHYQHSKQSVKTRKSSLNYFFESKYFGYGDFYIPSDCSLNVVFLERYIFEITTDILIDYFDYLKQTKKLSLSSKKTKWTLLRSFLNFTMEYYRKYNFVVIIPKHSINWNGIVHKEPKTNKNVVMSIEEIDSILDYLKLRNFKYYLIFRIFTETGMRKEGMLNIDCSGVINKKRYIKTIEKGGRKVVYYISKELVDYLKIYLNERELKNVETEALFLSSYSKRYGERQFNRYLKQVLKDLKIKKNVTCHTFRRSLNTFRKVMGCPSEDRKILLNHKVKDVNLNSYVKLNYKQYLELFDKWYPYKNIQI